MVRAFGRVTVVCKQPHKYVRAMIFKGVKNCQNLDHTTLIHILMHCNTFYHCLMTCNLYMYYKKNWVESFIFKKFEECNVCQI